MRKNKGFTLIELMIVVAVIAILATMALFGLRRAQAAARDTARQAIMRGVQTALENFYGDNGSYPASANFGELMTALVTYLPAANAPRDPKVDCLTAIPAAGAWAPCTVAGSALRPLYVFDATPNGTIPGCPVAASNGQGYELKLDKESGGSNFFCNPR